MSDLKSNESIIEEDDTSDWYPFVLISLNILQTIATLTIAFILITHYFR